MEDEMENEMENEVEGRYIGAVFEVEQGKFELQIMFEEGTYTIPLGFLAEDVSLEDARCAVCFSILRMVNFERLSTSIPGKGKRDN